MRLKFSDGSVREIPFNAKLAARLIYLSQQADEIDYRVELADRPRKEQERQASEIQHYLDHYHTLQRCGKKI